MLVAMCWHLRCVLWVAVLCNAVCCLASGGMRGAAIALIGRSVAGLPEVLVAREVSETAENISSLLRWLIVATGLC